MAGWLDSLKQGLVGTPASTQQFSRFTPQQQGLQNQSIQQLMSLLQGSGTMDNGLDFEPIAKQARTQFHSNTIPMIAERFASLGDNKNSSGLIGQLGSAGAGLEEGLASLKSKYNLASQGQQNQQRSQLLSLLLSLAMQPSFESGYTPSQPGLLQGLAGGLGHGLGSLSSLAPLQYLGLL